MSPDSIYVAIGMYKPNHTQYTRSLIPEHENLVFGQFCVLLHFSPVHPRRRGNPTKSDKKEKENFPHISGNSDLITQVNDTFPPYQISITQ
jgi:hypothetical protein